MNAELVRNFAHAWQGLDKYQQGFIVARLALLQDSRKTSGKINQLTLMTLKYKHQFFKLALIVAAMALSAETRSPAAPIVLNFDSLSAMPNAAGSAIPAAARLSNQYQSLYGVTFSSGSSYVGVLFMSPGDAPSGANVVGGSTAIGNLTFNGNSPIVATFSDPNNPAIPATTDFVSLRVDRFVSLVRPLTLKAFDINGNLLTSYTVPDSGGPTLQVSGQGIHSVQFIGTIDADGAAIDDFTFNPVVVPEPALTAFALVGGAVGFMRARKGSVNR